VRRVQEWHYVVDECRYLHKCVADMKIVSAMAPRYPRGRQRRWLLRVLVINIVLGRSDQLIDTLSCSPSFEENFIFTTGASANKSVYE
jgi:hypothetical protein